MPRRPPSIEPAEAGFDAGDPFLRYLQKLIFAHYKRIAYFLVLATYIFAFAEYFYLRMTGIIAPETLVYKKPLLPFAPNVTMIRTGFHYASTLAAFIAIELVQIVCFFFLTVSGYYLRIRQRYKNFISMEERMLLELRYHIRKVMFDTLYPTFCVFLMSSTGVFASIFYMVGMRDEEIDTPSLVFIHCFDFFVILYFVSFPIVYVIYHPDIQCNLTKFTSVPPPPRPLSNNASPNEENRTITILVDPDAQPQNGGIVIANGHVTTDYTCHQRVPPKTTTAVHLSMRKPEEREEIEADGLPRIEPLQIKITTTV